MAEYQHLHSHNWLPDLRNGKGLKTSCSSNSTDTLRALVLAHIPFLVLRNTTYSVSDQTTSINLAADVGRHLVDGDSWNSEGNAFVKRTTRIVENGILNERSV